MANSKVTITALIICSSLSWLRLESQLSPILLIISHDLFLDITPYRDVSSLKLSTIFHNWSISGRFPLQFSTWTWVTSVKLQFLDCSERGMKGTMEKKKYLLIRLCNNNLKCRLSKLHPLWWAPASCHRSQSSHCSSLYLFQLSNFNEY